MIAAQGIVRPMPKESSGHFKRAEECLHHSRQDSSLTLTISQLF